MLSKEVDKNIKFITICLGRLDPGMKDIVNGRLARSIMQLINPEDVAKKIYDMKFNHKTYNNGEFIDFYNI